jgi:hypothetical protein
MAETALVILVPEAEPIVSSFRRLCDPKVRAGVPAHITLIYPFMDGPIGTAQRGELRTLFAGFVPFAYNIDRIGHYAETLFLAPDRSEPFRLLVDALVERFGIKPYGGRYWPGFDPHLTIANALPRAMLIVLRVTLRVLLAPRLPLVAGAREVTLLEEHEGRWTEVATFPLGS